jgi:hypothetical protein
MCEVGSASEVVAEAERRWSAGDLPGQWLYQPLVKRLARDDHARAACAGRLSERPVSPLRISLAVALAAASGLPQEVADALARVLQGELGQEHAASLAYDPHVGFVRPVAAIVLDVLGNSLSLEASSSED